MGGVPRAVSAVVALLLLVGCGTEPVPQDSFYRLEIDDPARRYGTPLIDGTVEVERFSADGVIAQRAMVYNEGGPALRQYNYHYWAEAPTLMLQDAFIQGLRTAKAAERVVTANLRVLPDYRLVGRVKRLQHDVGAQPPRVRMALELSVVNARDGGLILLETYETTRTARDGSVAAAVTTFRNALTEVTGRFLDDLADAVRE